MLNMIRGIVQSISEKLSKHFTGTGRWNETITDREMFQHYGFTSHPLNGAEVLVLHKGNVLISVAEEDQRYRLQIQDGEVALYTDQGDAVYLKRGNIMELRTKTLQIGDASASHPIPLGDILEQRFNAHIHMAPTGPSGPPTILLDGSELSTMANIKV